MQWSIRAWWLGACLVGGACREDGRGAEPGPAAGAELGDGAPTTAEPTVPPAVPALPRPADPAAFEGHYVLVPTGATLYLGPEPGADALTLRLPPAAGERAPTPAAAMRVVGHEGGRLEVRLAAADRSCVPPVPGLASFDVALWVEPTALARVLGRVAEARFDDGTSVVLRPGVLVGPPADRVEVSAGGLRLAVPIAEGDVSTLYLAEPLPAVPTGLRRLEPGAPLTYAGGEPVLPESALVGGGLVLAQRVEGTRAWVRVGSACAEIEAAVDPARLVTPAADGGSAVAMAQGGEPPLGSGRYAIRGPADHSDPRLVRGDRWRVDSGKPITWPSGAEAGTMTTSHVFGEAPIRRGDRLCFTVAPSEAAVTEGERLSLCLREADVLRQEDPLASSGILGLLAASPPSSSIFGTMEDPALDPDVWGGLMGNELGSSFGAGGLGSSGAGEGGGGGGVMDLGTLGHGRGPSGSVEVGKATATGLEDAQVRKVVARSRNQLRYCYEKELTADPKLAGTLALSLEVAAGAVTEATATSDALPASLLRCVERSAKRWSLTGDGTLVVPVTLSVGG